MALTNLQKTVLTAVGVGIVVGLVVGSIGAMLGLSAGIRGGLTGAAIVIALGWVNRRVRASGGM